MADIPYDRLSIPDALIARFKAGMGQKERYALARAALPLSDEALMGVCYLLSGDEDPQIAEAAKKTLTNQPAARLATAINRNTHPKVMEFLAEFHPDPELKLAEVIYRHHDANDRTAMILARKADERLCEIIAVNHTRLLLTPRVLLELKANPNCPPAAFSRAESFLRMQGELPEEDAPAPAAAAPAAAPAPAAEPMIDLEAEIEAALAGKQSPALLRAQGGSLKMFDVDQHAPSNGGGFGGDGLGSFRFDFRDGSEDFSWNLTAERGEGQDDDQDRVGLEAAVKAMSVGQKIKLAYKGNKEVRAILLRDSNKSVAGAVVKSGRMTDGEIVAAAGNRNLGDEVIREIAMDRECTRMYPVKVALTNNSKTPVPIALAMLKSLHKKDLKMLSRNRNVSSVVAQAAIKLVKQKFERD